MGNNSNDIGDKDPYSVLEIDEDASAEEVKNAFKRMALKYHPDKIRGSTTSSTIEEVTMQDVNEAYETLRDPEKRRLYDMRRRAYAPSFFSPTTTTYCASYHDDRTRSMNGGMGMGLEDLLDILNMASGFASGKHPPPFTSFPRRKGPSPSPPPQPTQRKEFSPHPPLTVDLPVPLRVVRDGGRVQSPEISFDEACPSCHRRRMCPGCSGEGYVTHTQTTRGTTMFGSLGNTFTIKIPCAECSTTGLRNGGRLGCPTCEDKGEVRRTMKFTVSVPVGVRPDDVLDPQGAGVRGPIDAASGLPRRLLFRTKYAPSPDESVTSDGSGDVAFTVPLPLGEVLAGFENGEKRVTVMGDEVVLRNDSSRPCYRDPTKSIVLPGMGLPRHRDQKEGRGDLIINFRVIWPRDDVASIIEHNEGTEREREREKEKGKTKKGKNANTGTEGPPPGPPLCLLRERRIIRNIEKYKEVLRVIFAVDDK